MNVWWTAARSLMVMTLLTGMIYPLFITLLGKTFFPKQASGSLILHEEKVMGSELIGQKFESPKYFWPRPSAVDYNPLPSGASNYGATSKDLKTKVEERKEKWTAADSTADPTGIPQELLFASGSGLDPHLSPTAVQWQLNRIAQARKLNEQQKSELEKLVKSFIEPRSFGFLGEERINVLNLNRALDEKFPE